MDDKPEPVELTEEQKRSRRSRSIAIAVVLGSGLGDFADSLDAMNKICLNDFIMRENDPRSTLIFRQDDRDSLHGNHNQSDWRATGDHPWPEFANAGGWIEPDWLEAHRHHRNSPGDKNGGRLAR